MVGLVLGYHLSYSLPALLYFPSTLRLGTLLARCNVSFAHGVLDTEKSGALYRGHAIVL